MKILRIISSIDPKGGGPIEGAKKIDIELKNMGHHIEVISLDKPGHDFISLYPAPVHAIGPSKTSYKYNSKLVDWLNENQHKYDAVIVNGIWQYHSFAAWRSLSSKTPYFVFTHGMLDPWFKKTYPLKHLKKWIYWPWAEYRVLRDAQAVIFTCEEERLLARKSFWLYKAKESVTSYGTSNPPQNNSALSTKFLDKYPELKNKRIVLFLSRIHEKKGCDLLLEAFGAIAKSDTSLHLVMAGPDQTGWASTLQSLAEKLGISHRITWPGMLQGDDKWGAYYSAEVFCLPSHQENFGIVVAEALACGRPVLISDKVNIWREIEADAAGFVDNDTVEGTLRNLHRWLALSAQDYQKMSTKAESCFTQRFHIRSAAERLIEIIEGNSGKI